MNKINIINAGIEHSEIIWQWRNDPQTLKMFFEGRKVSFSEHKNWFNKALLDDKIIIFIGKENDYPVGVIRFDQNQNKTKEYDVSINISPSKRGLGIGKVILLEGIKKLKYLNSDSKVIFASVKNINVNSKSLFKSCGFIKSFESDQITKYKFEFS